MFPPVRISVLVVASHPQTILGLAQAMLKFGYQIMTAYPDEAELQKIRKAQPNVVVLRPPTAPDEARACLDLVRSHFIDRDVPVIACVSSQAEESGVRERLGEIPVVTGSPLQLNDLYSRIQEMFHLARRRELRISMEMIVGHRVSPAAEDAYYDYDTMVSLSMNGCFIRTDEPYPIGSPVELVFSVGGGAESLRAIGRVCRHGSGSAETEEGMGVSFENISALDRSRLESFLMTHLGSAELPLGL